MASPIMVDWITASVTSEMARSHESESFDTGRILKVTRDGDIEQEFSSRFSHQGSFESSLSFRAPYPWQLEMSGNPVKYLQGHNLFGSDECENLFFAAGLDVSFRDHSPFPVPITLHGNLTYDDGTKPAKHLLSKPRFTRIDLTRSYKFKTNEEARAWLRAVGATGHSRHKNGLRTDGTIYYGQSSSRWAFKIYHKFDEITSKKKGHEISFALPEQDRKNLIDWAEGVVRFELTLRRPEIEKLPENFNSLDVWKQYYSRIQFNRNAEVTDMNQLGNISPRLKTLYAAWKSGVDIRSMYSKNAFYANRRIFLDIGIDIAVPPTKEQQESVLTLEEIQWDPEPIEELMVRPDDSFKEMYGVK